MRLRSRFLRACLMGLSAAVSTDKGTGGHHCGDILFTFLELVTLNCASCYNNLKNMQY